MKEFIYLDTSFLQSFIAQTNNGLPLSTSTEFQESETKTNSVDKNNQLQNNLNIGITTGELAVPGLFKLPTSKGDYGLKSIKGTNESATLTQLDAAKEIITKQLHDNALHDFEEYLKEKDLLKYPLTTDELIPGSYISYRGKFEIIDMEFLSSLLNPEKLSTIFDLMISEELKGIKEAAAGLDNKTKQQILGMSNKAKKDSEDTKKQFNQVAAMLDYISLLLPHTSYIRIDKYLCPLKSNFLREKSKELIFKYGRNSTLNITVIGKYTKIFDNIADANSGSGITAISSMLDGLTQQLDIIKKGDHIVSPIAIYFD
ncbi:MAG: hypothetical protein ACE3L7_07415 [Candidatus Pristimantibacillus sp.]